MGATKIPTIEEFSPPLQQTVLAFFTPHEQPTPTCSYPMNIDNLFPFWLKHETNKSSNLILMTKEYYNWLSCGMEGNDLSFLNLESLIDIENIPDKLLKYHLYSYIHL